MAEESYLAVDQAAARAEGLVRRYPGRARLWTAGHSRSGAPLRVLSVAGGEQNVLVVAGPHANEQTGAVACLLLAEAVLSGEDVAGLGPLPGCSWHFLLSLDPDGARLNEGWMPRPDGMAGYYRHFFRPVFAEQPEWIPDDASRPMLPETRALIGLLDELTPVLQCSLHGVDLGGSYVVTTRELPGLAKPFTDSARCAAIPVDAGPFDAYYWPSVAPGVHVLPRPGEPGSQFAALLHSTENSTWRYPERHGTATAVIEVPMWAADAVSSADLHPDPAGARSRACAYLRDAGGEVAGLYARAIDHVGIHEDAETGPLLRTCRRFLRLCPELAAEWSAQDWPATDTIAHITALELAARQAPLRAASPLLRLLSRTSAAKAPDAFVRREGAELKELAEKLTIRLAEDFATHFPARPVPLDQQAAHQARTVVAAARSVLHR
ncbi:M14 family zinc carboxypeptidase [Streptomyces sp. NPDC051940]|uniref:M14 family zinc carboxypeptidase n=1 Tax=Streptomyces sp. NPDC051940 TaxID=3155675 RepID=UPI003436234F